MYSTLQVWETLLRIGAQNCHSLQRSIVRLRTVRASHNVRLDLTLGVLFFLDATFVTQLRETGKNDDVRAVLKEICTHFTHPYLMSLICSPIPVLLPRDIPKFVICNKMDHWWLQRCQDDEERPGTLDRGLRELREYLITLHPQVERHLCFSAIKPRWGRSTENEPFFQVLL